LRSAGDRVFDTIEAADWHIYQILTKRSSRMRDYIRARYGARGAPGHVWLGVSIEDGARLSRAVHLRQTPAALHFLSLEPLIGPVGDLELDGIGWVIVGGESGPRARRVDPDWVRAIRDRCLAATVPLFFKQWGGARPSSGGRTLDGTVWSQWPTPPTGGAPELRPGPAEPSSRRTDQHGSAEDHHLEA
jgi:protein gp37